MMMSTKDHIDALHHRVADMLRDKMPEERIIEQLSGEGFGRFYIETVIGNVQNDAYDKKAFIKLVLVSVLCFAVCIFLYLYPGFERFRWSLLFCILFFTPLISGITLLYRAFAIFKK